jgi:fibro-slime domain-containing protein
MDIGLRIIALAAMLAGAGRTAQAQESITLTGVVRDFAELKEGDSTGGHPDFNPNVDPATGRENWACFDKPDAGKGAVQGKTVSTDANPDKLPGFVAYDRDEVGPALKAASAAPPNCFRSRFGEWYTTRAPEINRAFFLDLTFAKQGSVYKYDNPAFFPLDSSKLGALKPQVPSVTATFGHRQPARQEGFDPSSHNFGFTFEFHAKFTYKKGTGQRFDFRGDDDVWVFINDSLAIDLGGIHSAEYAAIDLDNMGLADGKLYPLDFYFAERRITESNLVITTSLELKPSTFPPPPPPPPSPIKAVEGWLYDRNGDGIADKAEIAFDKQPTVAPTAFELDLKGEAATGGWDAALDQDKVTLASKSQFFTKPGTGWDENDPANRGKAANEAASGLTAGTFPLHDRIGAVIDKAWKLFLDTSLNQVPKQQIRILFTEPVAVGSPLVLKFQDPSGAEKTVLLSEAIPDSAVGGRSLSWTFTIAAGTPNEPGEKWKVAIAAVDLVRDASDNPSHPANPWRLIDAKLPSVVIGELKAEKGGKIVSVPDPAQVHKAFILLSSSQAMGAVKDYAPLHPEQAEDWIKTDYSDSHGLAVFTFKLSHPAKIKLMVYDNLGQYVNRSEVAITRDDLQSGKLARDPATRAYFLRLAWFPVSEDGTLISTGAYILRASFEYGLDPRDYVEKGSKVKVSRFGFMRNSGLRGLGQP